MQEVYIPGRELRFQAMLELLAAVRPAPRQVLDLGCGPGSLSRRFLERFPRARCVALDANPALLALGRAAVRDPPGHLQWVDADLRDPGWARAFRTGSFDAVISTTALHWLTKPQLAEVYRSSCRLLRPGGVLLDGDKVPFGAEQPQLHPLVEDALHAVQRSRWKGGMGAWESFWKDLGSVPGFRPLLEEARRRFPDAGHHGHEPTEREHMRLLRRSGFEEAVVVWREFSNAVVLARKGAR